jgi:4-hydroxy-3-polyprenylbenzoate decarboxylase
MNLPIILGITGASGAIYAMRLLETLLAAGRDVHLSISPSGRDVLQHELQLDVDLTKFDPTRLRLRDKAGDGSTGTLHYYHYQDFMAPMASGSFLTAGMAICPCSGSTLSSVAAGSATNLIQRAAEVQLKERRRLVLVPREAPLSLAHIDNMRRVTEAGGVILPASPGFYHGETTVDELVNFVTARICDQLGVEHALTKRWGTE